MARVEDVLRGLGIEFDPRPRQGWLFANCPYHEERTPSWRIRITSKRYGQHHCFGCKAGGTLAGLVRHVRKIGEFEALLWLETLGTDEAFAEELPAETFFEMEPRVLGGRALSMPLEVIQAPLEGWVTPAREYVRARGVTDEQTGKWALGYAVDGKLDGRIVIPVYRRGPRGQRELCSYMARDYVDRGARKRYLYPSTDEGVNLDVMFGEEFWPAGSQRDAVAVTEGAFNALAVEREMPLLPFGALGGSGIIPAHVLKLTTFKRILLLTDDDPAGDKAATALYSMLSRQAVKVVRIMLPNGEDANEVERRQRGLLREALCEGIARLT